MGKERPVEEMPGVLPLLMQNSIGKNDKVEVEEYDNFTIYLYSNHCIISYGDDYTQYTASSQMGNPAAYDYLKDVVAGEEFRDAIYKNYEERRTGIFGSRFSQMFEGEKLPEEYREELDDIADKFFTTGSLRSQPSNLSKD